MRVPVCMYAFSGNCKWGKGWGQKGNMNGKYFLPCLPTLGFTLIIKKILPFLKYIHRDTFSYVYLFIIQNEHAVEYLTSFLCDLCRQVKLDILFSL